MNIKKNLTAPHRKAAAAIATTSMLISAGLLWADSSKPEQPITRLVQGVVKGPRGNYDRALDKSLDRDGKTRVHAKDPAKKKAVPPTSSYANNENGVRRLLQAFLEPGADHKALTKALQPTRSDFHRFFKDRTARRIYRVYLNDWEKGRYLIKPRKGQTSLVIHKVKVKDLLKRKGLRRLPRGYNWVIPRLNKEVTIYAFTFAKPGQKVGRTYAGLTFVNHHWVIFPKPWEALFRIGRNEVPRDLPRDYSDF